MPSPYRKEVLAQVLDGKRLWSNAETGGDRDVFYTQVVIPLRELKYEGVFDTLNEIEFAIDGDTHTVGVEIIGGINYLPEGEDEYGQHDADSRGI
jgi:hypothetical protein